MGGRERERRGRERMEGLCLLVLSILATGLAVQFQDFARVFVSIIMAYFDSNF